MYPHTTLGRVGGRQIRHDLGRLKTKHFRSPYWMGLTPTQSDLMF